MSEPEPHRTAMSDAELIAELRRRGYGVLGESRRDHATGTRAMVQRVSRPEIRTAYCMMPSERPGPGAAHTRTWYCSLPAGHPLSTPHRAYKDHDVGNEDELAWAGPWEDGSDWDRAGFYAEMAERLRRGTEG